jgi:hypothetical protein
MGRLCAVAASRTSCHRIAQRSHATLQAPSPTAMFPGGSVSHPQGAKDKGDDEHADAGKKQVQKTMHHDAQDAQRQGRDHQEQKQDNHSIPR